MKRLLKWLVGIVGVVLLVGATVVLLRAFDARRKPPLKPWHEALDSEFRASDATERSTLEDYLAIEDRVMKEMDRVVYDVDHAPEDRTRVNRYWRDSPINPQRFTPNWNRTQVLEPQGALRGGVLLVHGLTDSPYSVRAIAEIYRRHGFYALCLRMPGHGTVPGALTKANWEDWRAAARIGVRHVRRRIGPSLPLHLVGYSNGGEIVTQYAVDTLSQPALPRVERVVLLSPMIGVSPYAGLAKIIDVVGAIPYFEQSRWLDVLPEYIPFKYDSFPAYAGQQTAEATEALDTSLAHAVKEGRIGGLPPILAFVSLVDSTVETWATVDRLYARLAANGSALVLFDLNRSSVVRPFLKTDFDGPGPGAVGKPETALRAHAGHEREPRYARRRRPLRGRGLRAAAGVTARPRVAAEHLLAVASRRALPAGRPALRHRAGPIASTTARAWGCSRRAASAASRASARISSCG